MVKTTKERREKLIADMISQIGLASFLDEVSHLIFFMQADIFDTTKATMLCDVSDIVHQAKERTKDTRHITKEQMFQKYYCLIESSLGESEEAKIERRRLEQFYPKDDQEFKRCDLWIEFYRKTNNEPN